MKIDVASLRQMPLDQLRDHWRRHCKGALPQHGSRDLLVRAIVFQQEAATSASAVRKADRRVGAASSPAGAKPALKLSPGTVLVREWNGVPHAVTVTDKGFLWDGRPYGSLSAIATVITGVRWNGPRFFKLDEMTSEATP